MQGAATEAEAATALAADTFLLAVRLLLAARPKEHRKGKPRRANKPHARKLSLAREMSLALLIAMNPVIPKLRTSTKMANGSATPMAVAMRDSTLTTPGSMADSRAVSDRATYGAWAAEDPAASGSADFTSA